MHTPVHRPRVIKLLRLMNYFFVISKNVSKHLLVVLNIKFYMILRTTGLYSPGTFELRFATGLPHLMDIHTTTTTTRVKGWTNR